MFKAIDLFSGAGLLSLAFKNAGFKLVRAIEMDRAAALTYQRNLGDHVEIADITTTTPTGKCDVIVAGPPCQGFSTLGKCEKDDPRNRLSHQVVRWTKVVRPKIVVIENVAKFIESSTWKAIAKEFEQLGYSVWAQTIDACYFGVAQKRVRSFTFASRVGKIQVQPQTKTFKTVREAWKGLSDEPSGERNHYAPAPSALALARMKLIPIGGDKRDIMRRDPSLTPQSWWNIPGDVTDVWGRMEWDQPSNTLRTCLQNPSKGRYIHPEQHRVVSLREAARLQSIPDNFEFIGKPTQISRQIGNSVPPRVGRALADAIRDALR